LSNLKASTGESFDCNKFIIKNQELSSGISFAITRYGVTDYSISNVEGELPSEKKKAG